MFRLMWVWMVGDGWTLSGYGLGWWAMDGLFSVWVVVVERKKERNRKSERLREKVDKEEREDKDWLVLYYFIE